MCVFLFQRLKSIPDDICKVCLASVQLARDILNDSYVKDTIHENAEDFCSYLPAMFFSKCLAFVEQAEPKYYKDLVDLLEPHSTCHHLQLCQNSSQANMQGKVITCSLFVEVFLFEIILRKLITANEREKWR